MKSQIFSAKLKAVTLGALLGMGVSTTASANLQGMLDEMFMSNATSPKPYESQMRSGYTFGSFTARAPIKQINLVSFDPPRLNAGCGGIDMFGGSFSFINADQLVALLRTIAANAVGALFYTAIQSINPAIANVMSKFQNLVHALNMNSKNTCQIANQLVDMAFDPSKKVSEESLKKNVLDPIAGAATDFFTSVTDVFSSKGTKTQVDATSPSGEKMMSPSYSNLTWRVLYEASRQIRMGNLWGATVGDQQRSMEILMSLLGTEVVSDKPKEGTAKVYPPSITDLNWFVKGLQNDEKVVIYTCPTGAANKPDGCDVVSRTTLDKNSWPGIEKRIYKLLYGLDYKPGSLAEVAENSIVGRVLKCSSSSCIAFTANEKAFVSSSPIPFVAYMRKLQRTPETAFAVIQNLTPILVDVYTAKTLGGMGRMLNQVFSSGVSGQEIKVPETAIEAKRFIDQQVVEAGQRLKEMPKRIVEASNVVDIVIANMDSIKNSAAMR